MITDESEKSASSTPEDQRRAQYELRDVASIDPSFSPDGLPRDQHNLVYLILLIHGVGTLMPWNMFINAQAYFREYKLHPPNSESESLADLRKNFLSYLGLCSQIPNVAFNALNLLVNMGSGNLRMRVTATLMIEILIFAVTVMLVLVDSSKWAITFFYITMVSVVILNMASGIYQNCIFGTGAKFPMKYTNAILIGSNFSGTFTSVINILSIWLAPDPRTSATYYFLTALVVLLICLVTYNMLQRNKFYRHYDLISRSQSAAASVASNTSGRPQSVNALKHKWSVFCKCWPQCLNVFLTFYVTLAIFPAVLSNISQVPQSDPGHMPLHKDYFIPVSCFLVFNVCAMLGNLMTNYVRWPKPGCLWITVVARFAFIPLFLYCRFNMDTRKWPVYINNDWIYTVANALLGLSSGYLSSLCMMFASNGLDPDDAPVAGMIAAFFLVFGIFCGINSSFFLTWIVEH